MEKIKELIHNGDLENAKIMIEALEAKLINEGSSRIYETIKTQVSTLKKLYASKIEAVSLSNVKNIDIKYYNIKNEFDGNIDKPMLKGLINTDLTEFKCKSIDITGCNNIKIEMIDCEDTVFLNNTAGSTITVKSKYIRLNKCNNLHLKILSFCGVFLQDSKDIKIESVSGFDLKIFDFSSPMNSKNYQII